jgi:hypothetical protein
MLVKLLLGVNFINVKRERFSYKHHFSSYMYVKKWRSYEKFVRLTLMKLTTAVQEVPVRQVLGGGDGPEVGPDEWREEKKIRKVFQEERRGDKNTNTFWDICYKKLDHYLHQVSFLCLIKWCSFLDQLLNKMLGEIAHRKRSSLRPRKKNRAGKGNGMRINAKSERGVPWNNK